MSFVGTSACSSVVDSYAGVGRAPRGPCHSVLQFRLRAQNRCVGSRGGGRGLETGQPGVGVRPVDGGTGFPQMLVRVEALHSGIHPVTQAEDMEALRGKGTRLEPQIQVLGGLSGAPFSPAPLTR